MKNKKKLVAAVIGLIISVAGYYGVGVPSGLEAPVAEALCSSIEWC